MEVNSIGPINSGQPIRRVSQPSVQPESSQPRRVAQGDQLQLSPTAEVDSAKIDQASTFKSERIEQIRQQIADGTYETEQKLSDAIDLLIPQLTND